MTKNKVSTAKRSGFETKIHLPGEIYETVVVQAFDKNRKFLGESAQVKIQDEILPYREAEVETFVDDLQPVLLWKQTYFDWRKLSF